MRQFLLAMLLATPVFSVASISVEFEMPESFLTDENGAVIESIQPGSIMSVAEGAASLPPGQYVLVTPSADLEVVDDTPPVEPPVDPPPQTGNWRDAFLPFIPPVGEIRRIPNTALTPVLLPSDGSLTCAVLKCHRSFNVLNVWSGMSFDEERGIFRIIASGGHSDIGANSVYSFDASTLTWSRDYDYSPIQAPFPDLVDTDGDGWLQCVELEDGPYGVHTYDSQVYVPPLEATVMFRVKNYVPTGTAGFPGCKWNPIPQSPRLWEWTDAGEYLQIPIDEFDGYQKTAWDDERQKIYLTGIRGRLKEIDPFTWEIRDMDRTIWGGSGGHMIMDGRDLYVTSLNGGLYHIRVDLDGNPVAKSNLVNFGREDGDGGWDDEDGTAVSEGIVVGWDGNNRIRTYNTQTGEYEEKQAAGDILSGVTMPVYEKWWTLLPGVFIGIADNDGWVIYREF